MIKIVILVVIALTLSLQAQQEHKLPVGEWCQPNLSSNSKAHVCDCKRMCADDKDNPGRIVEDPNCKSYCTPSQCNCEVHGCP